MIPIASMRSAIVLMLGLSVSGFSAQAQSSADLAKVESDLIRVVDAKIQEIGTRSTYADRVGEARSRLLAAQSEWRKYREVECAAAAAVSGLIGARGPEDLTTRCMYFMTERRIEAIAEY